MNHVLGTEVVVMEYARLSLPHRVPDFVIAVRGRGIAVMLIVAHATIGGRIRAQEFDGRRGVGVRLADLVRGRAELVLLTATDVVVLDRAGARADPARAALVVVARPAREERVATELLVRVIGAPGP